MNAKSPEEALRKEISAITIIDELRKAGIGIEGEYGEELILPPDYKPLSDEAISFILMKEKEIKECEEEVKLAESNLKAAKKKLYSSKHCLESFRHSATNNTK